MVLRIKSKLVNWFQELCTSLSLHLGPFSPTNSVTATQAFCEFLKPSSLQPQDLVCFYSTSFAVWKAPS